MAKINNVRNMQELRVRQISKIITAIVKLITITIQKNLKTNLGIVSVVLMRSSLKFF